MDITETLAPNSDQLDAIELAGSPRTFRITDVTAGKDDQPVNVHLEGFPRVWRPGKSMRRVLAAAWGTDASVYVGRSVTLYCDETVQFGGAAVGGTRISHMSHIDGPKRVPLLVKRGKSEMFTVQPLPDTPRSESSAQGATNAEPTLEAVTACTDLDALKVMWKASGPERREQITARVAEIKATTVQGELGAES